MAKKITGIKRIGFDLDGTLYEPDACLIAGFRNESYADLAKKKNISLFAAKKLFDEAYKKNGSTKNARRSLGLGKTRQGALKESIEAVNKCLKEDKTTTRLLKKLGVKYGLDLISVNLKKTILERLTRLKLAGEFEHVVYTNDGKDDGSAFSHWIKKTGCKPSELAYVGDKLKGDVLIPKKMGINAIFLNRKVKKPVFKNGFWTISKLTDLTKII